MENCFELLATQPGLKVDATHVSSHVHCSAALHMLPLVRISACLQCCDSQRAHAWHSWRSFRSHTTNSIAWGNRLGCRTSRGPRSWWRASAGWSLTRCRSATWLTRPCSRACPSSARAGRHWRWSAPQVRCAAHACTWAAAPCLSVSMHGIWWAGETYRSAIFLQEGHSPLISLQRRMPAVDEQAVLGPA